MQAETLTEFHSTLRWLLVALAILLFLRLGQGGLARGQLKFGHLERLGMTVFRLSMGVQWFVGVWLFIVLGEMNVSRRWEHAITMTLAVAILEIQRTRYPGRTDGQRYRQSFLALVIASALVFIGVLRLPTGWSF